MQLQHLGEAVPMVSRHDQRYLPLEVEATQATCSLVVYSGLDTMFKHIASNDDCILAKLKTTQGLSRRRNGRHGGVDVGGYG